MYEDDQAYADAQLEQILGLGTLNERRRALEQQMAEAYALRQQGPRQHGPWGAALQGVADMLNAYTSKRTMHDLRGQEAALLDKQEAARKELAKMWGNRVRSLMPTGDPIPHGPEEIAPAPSPAMPYGPLSPGYVPAQPRPPGLFSF